MNWDTHSGRRILVRTSGAIVLVGAAAIAIADTPPVFDMTLMGTLPGGSRSWATDVNIFGDVAGYATTSGISTPHAFKWDTFSGTMTDLGTLTGVPADESFGWGISQHNWVVGDSDIGIPGARDAFLWFGAPPMLPIGPPPPGYAYSAARDITFDFFNALHRAVGWAQSSSGTDHACEWDIEFATSFSLGNLTGNPLDISRAYEVSTDGDIAGFSTRGAFPTHAFFWKNMGMIDIDTRGNQGGDSWAYGLNDAEQVVGAFEEIPAGIDHACRWQFINGTWQMTDLGVLSFLAHESTAHDIGENALVVGWSHSTGTGRHAAMWLSDQIFDLNSIVRNLGGMELKEAYSVNYAGQIVGYGVDEQGNEQGFILDPVTLLAHPPVPGIAGQTNDLYVNGATPRVRVFWAYGFAAGSTAVPGCPGLFVDIASAKRAGSAIADNMGTAILSVAVVPGASGRRVLIQAVERSSCTVSNLVSYRFP